MTKLEQFWIWFANKLDKRKSDEDIVYYEFMSEDVKIWLTENKFKFSREIRSGWFGETLYHYVIKIP